MNKKKIIFFSFIFELFIIANTQIKLIGPFWVDFKEFQSCNLSINYPIQFNFYPRKDTKYSELLFGNITLQRPLDDSLRMSILLGNFDTIGLRKENSLAHVKKACTSLKMGLYGEKTWKIFTDTFKIPADCPWSIGHYVSSGFNTSAFKESHFPKSFIYGKYTSRLLYLDRKNNIISCTRISIIINPYS
ncbi:uncharacterized protein LOC126904821 [Daktulosphaira vitifoliae]|uniref:uncharacterized protein LOC126904821 n=1 Tax=Daktulosphaira vitifoliae TaxID=58002 RepID=UPI0021A9C989|nr:uncharacterized protein LOC126904821 [Daktulosphaira vitifoliae]